MQRNFTNVGKFLVAIIYTTQKDPMDELDNMSNSKMEGIMSFRDFKCFSLALLAKQLWRILTRLCFLAATILKEKYFKNDKLDGSPNDFSWI